MAVESEFARHIGFTQTGIPIYSEMNFGGCIDQGILADLPAIPAGIHISYTSIGYPIFATTLVCCDVVDPCRPRVETDCLPGGIDLHPKLFLADVSGCPSADGKEVDLHYVHPTPPANDCPIPVASAGPVIPTCNDCDSDPTKGKWIGSVDLAGGTVSFEVCCTSIEGPPGIFTLWFLLRYYGTCDGVDNEGCLFVQAACEDPIAVNFGQITIPNCCGCDPNHTDTLAEVAVYLRANCYANVMARHVDFTASGIPIYAYPRRCFNLHGPYTCWPPCGLSVTLTGDANCTCMDGTYTAAHTGGGWAYDGGWSCNGGVGGSLSLACVCNADGTATITATIVCGVDNTGTGAVTVESCFLDGDEITIPVVMEDPSAGSCTGKCRWSYNEMAVTWDPITSTCTGSCDECPNQPNNPPLSPTDGQIHEEDCTGSSAPDCCVGTVTVVVTRPGAEMLFAMVGPGGGGSFERVVTPRSSPPMAAPRSAPVPEKGIAIRIQRQGCRKTCTWAWTVLLDGVVKDRGNEETEDAARTEAETSARELAELLGINQ